MHLSLMSQRIIQDDNKSNIFMKNNHSLLRHRSLVIKMEKVWVCWDKFKFNGAPTFLSNEQQYS